MTTPFKSSEILHRTRSFRFLTVPLAATALGIAAIVAGRGEVMIKPLIGVGVTAAMFGGLASLLIVLLGIGRNETAGELMVSDTGVDFSGRRLVDRAHIKDGIVVPHASKQGLPLVALTTRLGGTHELVVRDEARGRELLTALGLDASQAVAQFSLLWRHVRFACLGVFGFVVALSIALGLAGVITGGAAFALLRFVAPLLMVVPLLALRSKLAVGADGILVTEPGNRRFIRYGDIMNVQIVPRRFSGYRALAITLRSGPTLAFPMTGGTYGGQMGWSRADAVVERIREAMATWGRGDAAPEARILERGKRPMTDWIRSLRAAGSGANADPRTAPVEPPRLWRIVEDPGGAPTTRAAAAVALGPSLDAAGRARLVVASEASASPKLRVALSAAASTNQDADLERALADLEAELETAEAAAPGE
jgi:hypothetical protein